MVKRLMWLLSAFASGWIVGGFVMIGYYSWRLLRDMDEPRLEWRHA